MSVETSCTTERAGPAGHARGEPHDFAAYRGLHDGAAMLVCGCGESLTLLDPAAAATPVLTIGVNDVERHFTPTYLVVVNPRRQFAADRFRHIASSRARALFTQIADLGVPHPRLVRFRLGTYGGTDLDRGGVLHYTQNSPYVAICLAVHMGARRIGVIGVDFTDRHFFGGPRAHPLTARLDRIDREYAALAAACAARGIEVVNVSPISRLRSLPRQPLPQFLESARAVAALAAAQPGATEVTAEERGAARLASRPGPAQAGMPALERLEPPQALPLETRVTPPLVASMNANTRAQAPAGTPRSSRVFVVNYRFLACGDVFTDGLRHAALELGVEVADASWDDPALPEKVARFGPDLLLVVHGRKFVRRWGAAFKRYRSAVWLLDEPYEVDDSSVYARTFDHVFVNDPSTIPRHPGAQYVPVCYDPRVHASGPPASLGTAAAADTADTADTARAAPRRYRVGFVGGANTRRERMLDALAQHDLLSYVVGGPWRSARLKALSLGDNVSHARTAELYRTTAVIVNVFRETHHYNRARVAATSMNPRIYEALACGAVVVSEARPEIAERIPEMPTFDTEAGLVAAVRRLLAEPPYAAQVRATCAARLRGDTYAQRLRVMLEWCMGRERVRAIDSVGGERSTTTADAPDPRTVTESKAEDGAAATTSLVGDVRTTPSGMRAAALPSGLPAGWQAIGEVATDADGTVTLASAGPEAAALTTVEDRGAVRLSFEVRLDQRCRFIAKIHHQRPGDWSANSYHLLAAPERTYLARHNVVLAPLSLPRGSWQRVDLSFNAGVITVAIGGCEVCRSVDQVLASGSCFIGVTGGTALLRAISVRLGDTPVETVVDGWSAMGDGTVTSFGDRVTLTATEGRHISLVSTAPANDVELEFAVRLEPGAHFITKIHHQSPENADANSYHLVCTPARGYLARHDRVLASASLSRRGWQRVRLRWIDQCLELFVNDRPQARIGDNLLQSGYCVVGVTDGSVELRALTIRDLSAIGATMGPPTPRERNSELRPGRNRLPFTTTPRRNLIYHVWPVRGDTWRWNVAQLLDRIDLFNGHRIIGIVHDARSEDPAEVQRAFAGHGCEFVIAPNSPAGEGVTFPAMLKQVRSLDPNEVTFYGHAKGVKYEPAIPPPVRRWADAQYRATLDHWPSVRAQLEQFAMTGCFRMLGRFRVHRYLGDWHYSGTFFWLRHAFVFARDLGEWQPFYGCVEAWPGVHFRREETGCLLVDNLRQLPYREEFWSGVGDAEVARWKALHPPPPPPPTLVTPAPFDHCVEPRLEQHPEEFSWLLDRLVAAEPKTLLCIGSMHGGVEWHVARRFRALGRDIHIVAVDLRGRPELFASAADALARFGQRIDVIVGDSTSAAVRVRLAERYDAVFIDGDHSYRGARHDADLALGLDPRLLALHDIVDSDWHAQAGCAVSRVWSELMPKYPFEQMAVSDWGGVGIIRCGK